MGTKQKVFSIKEKLHKLEKQLEEIQKNCTHQDKSIKFLSLKGLKECDLGVNIHCKVDGIYITVPPYPITGDDFTDSYANQILREDYDTDRIVKAIKLITKSYNIKVDLDRTIYGDNIKIKLKVNDE